jgi:hypothetical protein
MAPTGKIFVKFDIGDIPGNVPRNVKLVLQRLPVYRNLKQALVIIFILGETG